MCSLGAPAPLGGLPTLVNELHKPIQEDRSRGVRMMDHLNEPVDRALPADGDPIVINAVSLLDRFERL